LNRRKGNRWISRGIPHVWPFPSPESQLIDLMTYAWTNYEKL